LKPVIIIAITVVAMIGMVIPSVFADENLEKYVKFDVDDK
jgi:hypothetical protein